MSKEYQRVLVTLKEDHATYFTFAGEPASKLFGCLCDPYARDSLGSLSCATTLPRHTSYTVQVGWAKPFHLSAAPPETDITCVSTKPVLRERS